MSDPRTWPIPDLNAKRGRLAPEQERELVKAVQPHRIIDAEGHPAMAGQDIKAHLTRIFGFGGFDYYSHAELDYCEPVQRADSPGRYFDAAATGHVRLVIRNWAGELVAVIDEENVGEASAELGKGKAMRLAKTSAITLALKRAAVALGDQFGLSLYNGGSFLPIVGKTLEMVVREREARREKGEQVDDEEEGLAVPAQLADEMAGADPSDPAEVARMAAYAKARAAGTAGAEVAAPVERDEVEQRELLMRELEWMTGWAPRLGPQVTVRLQERKIADVPVGELAAIVTPLRHVVVFLLRRAGRHAMSDRYQARSDVAPLADLLGCEPDALPAP